LAGFYSKHCKLPFGAKIKLFGDVLDDQNAPKSFKKKISFENDLIWLNFVNFGGLNCFIYV